jgi:C4-dicarboxylate-binding protein DctP
MKLSRRDFGLTVGAAALATAYGRPGWAQAPVVIKYSHVVANDTPKGKGSLRFKELAEKYTGGKAKIEVYPNSSLYKDKEEIEALQLGAVQMLGPSTAKFAPLGAKEFEAMDLPFAFADDAAFGKIIKGELTKFLFS